MRLSYLSGFSPRFQRLSRSPWAGCLCITHPFATRLAKQAWPPSFDLHVLGTPPAFILSQDQTLHLTLALLSLSLRFSLNSLTLCVSSVQFSKISRPLSRARFVILPQFVSLSTVFSRTFFGSFFFCLFLCGVLYITCLSPLCKVFFSLFLLLFSVYAFRCRMA